MTALEQRLSTEDGALEWLTEQFDRARNVGPFALESPIPLTPQLATVLMTLNPNNRPLVPAKLRDFATDMREGRWKLNGENLILSIDGLVNDGQHRCVAVMDTGKTIKVFVTIGVSRESRDTVDTGVGRTVGHMLAMKGVIDANVKASAAGILWQWEKRRSISLSPQATATKAQSQDTYAKYMDEFETSAAAIPSGGSGLFGSRSVAIFTHLILSRIDRDKANEFMTAIRTGAMLDNADPRYLVRERLLKSRRLTPAEKVELMVRAWNMWREGRTGARSVPIINTIPEPK